MQEHTTPTPKPSSPKRKPFAAPQVEKHEALPVITAGSLTLT